MDELTLVLLRHFPTPWNNPASRRFTGWLDIDLAPGSYLKGVEVGVLLRRANFEFDEAHVSTLVRAQMSLYAVLKGMDKKEVLIHKDSRLNERRYGILQGRTHKEAIEEYGDKQVRLWRRDFKARPPQGESLEDTAMRVVAYWRSHVFPALLQRKRLIIVGHGNSLRAAMMHMAQMSFREIEKFEIPPGIPLICKLDPDSFALRSKEYLEV